MEREAPLDAGEQVFAARHDLAHVPPGQVGLGETGAPVASGVGAQAGAGRSAQLPARQGLARQRGVEAVCGAPDRVSLGHEAIMPFLVRSGAD